MNQAYFAEMLEKCESYRGIFNLVKRAVKEILGLHRVGLLLYLDNLPPHIGAYHLVGSNSIVLNKLLINLMSKSLMSKTEFNSLIFSLLLHEYLHSLGFLDEREVRRLVYEISMKTFGDNHPTVRMAVNPPLPTVLTPLPEEYSGRQLEIIREFEEIEHPYII